MAGSSDFELYRYTPTLVGAIIFIILFMITTFLHVYQTFQKRTYYFIPLIVGGFFEWIGYIGRALSHYHPTSLGPFIMQQLLLLLAPALFAASIYMILGRLILLTAGNHLSPIRPSRLTKIFVCGDVFSFFVQSSGGGLMASAKSMNTGKYVVVFGLILQIIFFGIFAITSAVFHKRIEANPTPESRAVRWQRYVCALYAASALILVRSLFRVVEFLGGNDGFLVSHEVFLYIFDAVLMLAVMVIFNLVHPGDIIGRKAQALALNDISTY